MDVDGSGNVSMDEFVLALERFGVQVVGANDKCPGGWPRDVVAALFPCELFETLFATNRWCRKG